MGRLLFLTVGCGFLWPGALPAQPRTQQDAAEWVLRLGGRVEWDQDGKRRSTRVVGDLPKPVTVLQVDLFNCSRLKDADLANLRQFSKASQVNLSYTSIGDEGLKHLAVLPALTHLYLGSTKITDAGLKALSPVKKLACLDLSGTGVTNEGLKHLGKFDQLQKLFLSRTEVTVKGLSALAGCNELTVLRAQGVSCEDVTPLNQWKKLAELSLSPDDEAAKSLVGLRSIVKLTVHGDQLTDDGAAALAAASHLKILHFSQTSLTDRGLKSLEKALPKTRVTARPVWTQSAFLNDIAAGDKVLRWKPGVEKDAWPGLMRAPAKLPGITRWQLESVEPRTAIADADWHPDGKRVALATWAGHIRIYELTPEGFRLLVLIPAHIKSATAVKWSPDGKSLVSTGQDARVRLWSSAGRLIHDFKGYKGPVTDVSWKPDGRQFVTVGNNRLLRIWNVDGTAGPTMKGHTGVVLAVDWHPDGTLIATGSADKGVRIWSMDTKESKIATGHTDRVTTVEWSTDGKSLASGSWDKTVRIWTRDGTPQKTIEGYDARVHDLAWTADGKSIATVATSSLHWHAADGKKIRDRKRRSAYQLCVAAHPKTVELLTGGRGDSTLQLWDEEGKPGKNVGQSASANVSALTWHPDSRRIVTGGWDRLVRLWSEDGRLRYALAGHAHSVVDLAYSPDGVTLASLSDRSVRLWTKDGLPLAAGTEKDQVGAKSVAWHPDGTRLLTGYWKGGLCFWSTDGVLQKKIPLPRPVRQVSWNPDGSRFVVGGDNKLLAVYEDNATSNKELEVGGPQLVAQWSPDGRHIVTGGWSSQLRIWRADGTLVKTLKPRSAILCTSWKPDSQQFASGFADGRLQINRIDGENLRMFNAHPSYIQQVAWSPDGKRIATGTIDNTLRIWNAETGQLERITLMFRGGEYATLSPAGQLLHGNRLFLEPQLVYLVEKKDGPAEMLTPTQFQERIARGKPAD